MIFIQREELSAGEDAQTLHRPDTHGTDLCLNMYGVFFYYYILFAITHIYLNKSLKV